ncbi:MAG: rhodanese-like domain-containing protein [Flavobacteriaceae bacterium]|nr:rhodanese-like domain-containing protein [Flavobacteriaceae bacterium]
MSKKYQLKKLSTRRYQILAAILIVLAAGLVLLPENPKHEGIAPNLFINKAMSTERYLSTDLIADKMINKDPSVLLVDVRSETEFAKFSLPNAVNIPLSKFLDEEFEETINQDVYDIVLFSNDNFMANEAWLLGNRLGYSNLFVMKGGLNEWFNTIISPKIPEETMPREAFELYAFRKAAGMYFGLGTTEVPEVKPVIEKCSCSCSCKFPCKRPGKSCSKRKKEEKCSGRRLLIYCCPLDY